MVLSYSPLPPCPQLFVGTLYQLQWLCTYDQTDQGADLP